jgi:hypothetical protein
MTSRRKDENVTPRNSEICFNFAGWENRYQREQKAFILSHKHKFVCVSYRLLKEE